MQYLLGQAKFLQYLGNVWDRCCTGTTLNETLHSRTPWLNPKMEKYKSGYQSIQDVVKSIYIQEVSSSLPRPQPFQGPAAPKMWFPVRCDTPVQNSGCRCPDLNIAHDVPKIREAQRSKHNTLFASHLPLGQSRSRDQQDKSKRGCMNTGLGQNRKTWCARRVCLPTKASWRYSRAILARPINRSRVLRDKDFVTNALISHNAFFRKGVPVKRIQDLCLRSKLSVCSRSKIMGARGRRSEVWTEQSWFLISDPQVR